MTIISVLQHGRTFPPSHPSRRRCPHGEDCYPSGTSVLGRVEGRGSRRVVCSTSLHRFWPPGTQPVTWGSSSNQHVRQLQLERQVLVHQ